MSAFVHLRVHTEFSLSDGIVRIPKLVEAVAAMDMPAVAITDLTNFYGLIKAYKAAQSAGIKLIVGVDFLLEDPSDRDRPHNLTLLAMNDAGYRNLICLISKAWQQGQYFGTARIDRDWIAEFSDGVLAISGGRQGDVGQLLIHGHTDAARAALTDWMAIFPDRFYLELHRTGRPDEEDFIHEVIVLAAELDCPVVATNDVRFLAQEEYEAHEARVCIGDGRTLDDPRRPRLYSEQQFLKSPEEMEALFSDIPEALANSVEIARRCSVTIPLGEPYLPDFPVPEGMTIDEFLARQSHEGLVRRFEDLQIVDDDTRQQYRDRLDFELQTISEMGFPGYFLVVMDFIRWGKKQGIPVGPGRGSGAGSLVAYALDITDLDPLQYDLLFERFLNPQRVSMPDFDVDFCMERRDEVIDYVAQTYGKEAVSQIITFGTMAAKAVVRDVARVQDKPYGLADKMSKLIPFEVGMTLDKAFEQEEALRRLLEEDTSAQEIWDMARQLEGITRNVGKHAGGVVIAPSRLTDFSPLYCDEEGSGLVTQYDKNDVEDAGLVKFDFLGLRTLTIIDWAVEMINASQRNGDSALNIANIPLDDAPVFDLLKRAETTAVFQLESRGMKDLIKRLQPDSFEDIIALVALFRPGPLQSGMVDNFINRKHGREALAYPDQQYQHPSLQPILQPTYGIILYQEQVMQIAQELAGYTLGGADLLRRAMGKKKPEEMAKQRSVFEEGAVSKGVDAELAMKIFDLVEKFAGYGFNKSHSAAYALVSYQTAWLKTHYPAEFMAAVMSSEMDNTDKLLTFRDECRLMKLVLKSPGVNEGQYAFAVNGSGEIVYGLGAIKGLGEGPIENLIAARSDGGPFKDLFDLCARTDPKKVNRRALEALVKSGALDEFSAERWIQLSALDDALRAAEQDAANSAAGMSDLFGSVAPSSDEDDVYGEHRRARAWTLKEVLNGEKESLGCFLSGHPIQEYEQELRKFVPRRIRDLQVDTSTTVAGIIVDVRTIKTQRGVMAVVKLDDNTGQIECTVYAEAYSDHRDLLEKDRVVLLEGRLQHDDYTGGLSMRVREIRSLEDARQGQVREIRLRVNYSELENGLKLALRQVLEADGGGTCPITLDYNQPKASAIIRLGERWCVDPSDELLEKLRGAVGGEAVEVIYDR